MLALRCFRALADAWYNRYTMSDNLQRFLQRFDKDRGFWIFVAAILVLFVVLQWRTLTGVVVGVLALIVAITAHEFSHAWAADLLHDPTARLQGRVTLNPLAHLDPLGTIMMLITVVTGMGIGWGKPVPVSPWRLRFGPRKGEALVALAGPLSNLVVAVVFALPMRFLGEQVQTVPLLFTILQALVATNIVIAMFNLLPFPPLDGHSVLIGILSFFRGAWAERVIGFFDLWALRGWIILFGAVIVSQLLGLNLFGLLIGGPTYALYRLLVG